ncbi:MAG: glycosyltransferase family 39 protein [Myxococcales bacterium]|nr:glycosyltransferase family 39 protein [Myxococcales bacterium]
MSEPTAPSAAVAPQVGTWAHFWAWAKVPIAIAVASRASMFLFGLAGLMWIGPSRYSMNVGRPWFDAWFRWDAGWYMQIVRSGYSLVEPEPGQRNTFFFPLYPMTVRAVGKLLGGDVVLAAVLVSNLCFVAAAIVLYRFVSERWNEEVAARSTALLACAPHAVYFSAAYAESLFLLCWVGAFYAAHRQRWLIAGVCVALSGASRLIGPIAGVGLGVMALEHAGWKLKALNWRVLFLGLAPMGVLAYMLFLQQALGSPWLFLGGQSIAGWGAGHSLQKLWQAFSGWRGGIAPMADLSHLVGLALASVVCVAARRKVGWPLTILSATTLVVYWWVWYSASRYLVVLFPTFIGLALLFEHRPRVTVGLIAGSALMQGMMTWIFTHADWVS